MKTGRPPLSDAEKKARGTLDPRWSEAARAARRGEKVVALFGSQVEIVPAPPPGLHENAQKEYYHWCRALHAIGKLTGIWVEKILLFSIARHNNITRLGEGKMPRGDDMKVVKTTLSEFGSINADTSISPESTGGRKFARFGFASRVRPPEAG